MSEARSVERDGALLERGEVVLHRAAHLVLVRGRRIPLPKLEFRLLELLMTHADHVLPTRRILDEIWGPEAGDDPNPVAVQVVRLRKKLAVGSRARQHLRTVRGVGYVFDTEPIEF